jgi:dicarboxylate transporter 10
MPQVTMPQTSPSSNSAAVPLPSPGTGIKPRLQKKQLALKQIAYPFWFGGSASSMAACVTHPLDLGMFFFS